MALQPLLHDETVILYAPSQAWSAKDGAIGEKPIHGIYHSDVRVVSSETVTVGDLPGEHIATSPRNANTVTFVSLLRHLDDSSADPRVRALLTRTVSADGATGSLRLESTLAADVDTSVVVRIESDLAAMDVVKSGDRGEPVTIAIVGQVASWAREAVSASVTTSDATLATDERALELRWNVRIPAKGSVTVEWRYTATDAAAVVAAATTPAPWNVPALRAGDDRLERWVTRALDDLDGLRMSTTGDAASEFLAAGAPWFFTLFGRDSIWAARFMLPLGTTIAASTLRVLAELQGTKSVPATAEQPGKIMHELRRAQLTIPGEGISLPPLYYGTVDATPLWACLLYDAWQWGMPEDQVRALLPNLVAALEWMRDYGDADGDGLLEYVDETGHGLSNQGWKDSGDSVQWRDGSLAEGPIALCEVQAYAYEAATHGADLLDHFGLEGAEEWRAWAARLQQRFRDSFWVASPDGAYPAIALDAQKRPVDTVTSNIGHLLGTGLLDARERRLVARRLASPELDSGYGLRTMSTDSAGYWPLSYHGGSVWAHDTAIAISGLSRDGFRDEASSLAAGLLAAAAGFGYRMPELHSGDPASSTTVPIPYPAACRPQAWSAAAAISVLSSTLGLVPSAQDGTLHVSPTSTVGALTVSGLRLGTADVSLEVNADGEVIAASGADISVG